MGDSMRIAMFTDVHGNKAALKAVLDDIKNENIDEIICLGDVIAIGPNSKECVDMIIDNNVSMVLGNHELYFLKGTSIDNEMKEDVIEHERWVSSQIPSYQRIFLEKCPLSIEKELNGKKILFEHFPIDYTSNEEYPFYDFDIITDNSISEISKKLDYDLIFIGHEHKAFSIDNKLYCIGSSGCTKSNITKYTILDTSDFTIKTKEIEFSFEELKEEVLKMDYPARSEIAKHFYDIEI